MAACVVAAMMLMAMRATPYLKVRGKIYAFSAADRRAEDGNLPTTFGQDLTQAADMLQRRFGDDDVPDTTGRNVTEALDALHRRFGSGDTSENAERDESEAVSSPSGRPREPMCASAFRAAASERNGSPTFWLPCPW